MIEFQRVDAPIMKPNRCVCGTQKGPLVDTHLMSLDGRVYLCRLCVKRSAIALGLAKGDRLDELESKAAQAEAQEKELAERDGLIGQLTESLADKDARIEQLRLDIERRDGQQRQRQHLAGILATTARELAEV